MKRFYLLVLTGIFVFPAMLSAEEPVMSWIGRERKNNSIVKNEKEIIRVSGPEAYVFSREVFRINHEKRYCLSGKFRRSRGNTLFFGIAAIDENGKIIDGNEAVPVVGSETILLSDIKKGDRTARVKDASKWKLRPGSVMAFGAENDCADLPNRELSRGVITHIEKDGEAWEITFRLPFRKEYRSGTVVRQQYGAPYQYVASGKTLRDGWQEFQGIFSGELMSSANKFSKGMYPGTKGVKIVVFVPGENSAFEMKDLIFQEIVK